MVNAGARPDAGTHPTLTPLVPASVAASEVRRDWVRDSSRPRGPDDASGSSSTASPSPAAGPHPRSRCAQLRASELWADVLHVESGARAVPLHGGRANITKLEEDAFWAWAIVETLRHTGIRIEELLEVCAKCLVCGRTPPDTTRSAPHPFQQVRGRPELASVPPAGFEPATHGLGNRCSIP